MTNKPTAAEVLEELNFIESGGVKGEDSYEVRKIRADLFLKDHGAALREALTLLDKIEKGAVLCRSIITYSHGNPYLTFEPIEEKLDESS